MDADFILIRRMKSGNDEAFDIFVHKYYAEILRYCSYHCTDIKYAEDITQETFLRFFENLSKYHYKNKTKNYLYTIAGNLCKNFNKKKKEIVIEEEQIEGKNELRERPMDAIINKLTIEWALMQLPDEFQQVIILHYIQGLKLKEIADMLQIGLPLVKYRLKKAKTKLQTIVREEGIYEY